MRCQAVSACHGTDRLGRLVALRNNPGFFLRRPLAPATQTSEYLQPADRLIIPGLRGDDVWSKLGLDERTELIEHIAGLPSAVVDDDISAKQFDYLMLQTQLAVLRAERAFAGYKKRIVDLASALEELGNVPMVAAELAFILEIQTDEFWQDVTPPRLETIRRRLRRLIKLIELRKRPHVYTDFEDEIGGPIEVELQGVAVGTDMHRFRIKARHFLKEHENHIAVQKVRLNEPLTAQDLAELERIFIEAAVAAPEDLERVGNDGGLGIFVRSLVGLDREAAKNAFDQFQCKRTLSANQIEFLNMIIDYLTDRGVMDPRLLYASPFTDFDAMGVEGVFDNVGVVELIGILEEVRQRAAA